MSTMSLSSFKNTLTDILRPNRFLLQFNNPTGVSANQINIQYYVSAAQIPGRTIKPVDLPWQGIVTKLAGDMEFPDWKVTFYDDSNYEARKFLEDWMNMIDNPTTDARSIQSAYQQNFLVQQLDSNGNVKTTYTVIGWPTEIADIELDQEKLSDFIKFEATFSIDYWTPSYS